MSSASSRSTNEPNRWAVLALLGVAQLMVVLGLLMLTLMALYFFLHRREEFEELEPLPEVLHPKTSTAGK